ncbi:MAG: hypothetical protein H0X29_01130 [Parachlamydiaceae bacterium]|nr:hypothetical protein [Parachlamydiaceae bacterium]
MNKKALKICDSSIKILNIKLETCSSCLTKKKLRKWHKNPNDHNLSICNVCYKNILKIKKELKMNITQDYSIKEKNKYVRIKSFLKKTDSPKSEEDPGATFDPCKQNLDMDSNAHEPTNKINQISFFPDIHLLEFGMPLRS